MTKSEASKILLNIEHYNHVGINEEKGLVCLDGDFTLVELEAILHIMKDRGINSGFYFRD